MASNACLSLFRLVCSFCFYISSGLYGVGKAAVNPPALVVLSHTPMSATRTIAWVGKGIVYDTGGLCIKAKVHTERSNLKKLKKNTFNK